MKEINIKIGAELRRCRIQAGMSQSELAKLLGITFQQLQKYESGKNRISLARFLLFAQALKITPNQFFDAIINYNVSENTASFSVSGRDSKALIALNKAYLDIPNPKIKKLILALAKGLAAPS